MAEEKRSEHEEAPPVEARASSPFDYTVAVSGVRPMTGLVGPSVDSASAVTIELASARLRSELPPSRGPDEATPDRIGPYRIVGRVGDGGMGVVYRAVREDDAGVGLDARVEVALKTVRARGPEARASLRREMHALARIEHDGVVRILDFSDGGASDGRPYYAMELIEGPTLAARFATVDRAESLPDTLGILCRLCETLAFLHGAGIVHRDLTPKNVVVRPDGAPVLVDFGLASRSGRRGRDALDADAVVGGTLNYIAPEQLRGDPIDPRADLYALGCILYEAVTGRPPFDGSSVTEIARCQLLENPPPPSSLSPSLDPELEALILRLLRKRRSDRLGYAEDVGAALAPFSRVVAAPTKEATQRARPYVYRPGFVGREDAIAIAARLLDHALEGQGARAIVEGTGGVGKTRFLGELANRARQMGFLVVTGECAAHAEALSLQPFRPMLAALVAVAGGSFTTTERLLGARGKLLAPFAPELLALPGQSDHPEPAPLPPQEAHDRIVDALVATIGALANEVPLVMVVDDVQQADELSLDLLGALDSTVFAGRRLLLVVSHRSDDTTERVLQLVRDPGTVRVPLGPFDAAAVDLMAGEMLALPALPDALRESLHGAAEGNPFFVSELLRLALDERWLSRAVGARWELGAPSGVASSGLPSAALPSAGLPSSVAELCARRLAALGPSARSVAEALAVIGHDADLALLAHVSGATEGAVMDALADLVSRALAEDAAEHFRIAHGKVREVAYRAVPAARRAALHQRTAEALERRAGSSRTGSTAALAHHWAQAGVHPRAIQRFEEAGLAATARAAHAEAAGFFEEALRLAPLVEGDASVSSTRRARWHRRSAESHFALGHLDASEEHAAKALAVLGRPLPSSRAGWARAVASGLARQAGHVLVPAARATRPRDADVVEEAALAASLAATRFYFAQSELPFLGSSLLAVNLAERARVEEGIAIPYAQVGFLAGTCKLDGRSRAYFARAHRGAASSSDARASVFSHEALLHGCQGRFADARTSAVRALEVAGRRAPQEREVAHVILAHVEHCTGRYEIAVGHGERLFESARARQNVQHEAFGTFAMARSLVRLGRHADAVERLEALRASGHHRHDPLVESIHAGISAQALAGLGSLDEAEAMAAAAMAAVARAGQAFSLADGYEGAAEVYLDAWSRARAGGRVPSRRWTDGVSAAGAAMRRFAALFPIGEPRYLLHEGRALALRGSKRRASWALGLAKRRALALGMPFEAARADELLAAVR